MENQIGLYEMFNHFNNQTLGIYLESKANQGLNNNDGNFIYWLIKDDKVVYIGKTNNTTSRIGQHAKTKKEFDEYFWFNVNPLDIDIIENFLIDVYTPKYNKQNSLIHKVFLGHLSMLSLDFMEQVYNLKNNIKDAHNRCLSQCEKISRLNGFITLLNLLRFENPASGQWVFIDDIKKCNNEYMIIPQEEK